MRNFLFEVFPLPEGIVVEKDVLLEGRDGNKLAANVYRPDTAGRFPVIMALTPYGKDQKTETYGLIMRSIYEHAASVGRI